MSPHAKRKYPPASAAPAAQTPADVERVFLPWKKDAPLAARMRPRTLEEYVGQEHILGPGKLLRRGIEADRLGSIILWGPPGSGKTTLARVIAGSTRSDFEVMNAVLAGVKEIREVVERARERLRAQPDLLGGGPRRTTLFVDEVHRFNKAQQDALLPHVENGTLLFIGATTENPYFEVIKPLVSRSRIFQLEKLNAGDLKEIARCALADTERGYGQKQVRLEPDALEHLVDVAQGDARNLLNALELAVETTAPGTDGVIVVNRGVAEESIQRRALLYDKEGDVHYDTISAFIKSLRGSDPDAALYWLAKMVQAGEDPRYIVRRLVIFASEDVGMADPQGLSVATAAAQAVEFVGLPECQWNLAHAVIYLATASKSNSAMGYFEAVHKLEKQGDFEVPNPLKDANRDREGLGHGQGYKYPHAFREHWVPQQYLPGELQGARFYHPGDLGFEKDVKERVERLRAMQETGLESDRQLEELQSGRARRRNAQVEEHGEARVRLRDRLLERAPISADHSAIDLGSRPGLLAWGILERVPLGKAAALSADAVAAARLREAAAAERVDRVLEVMEGDLPALPAPEASFHWALALDAFGPRADRARALAEALRVLKPGGKLVCGERLSSGRRISEDVDLTALESDLARRIREVEDEILSDSSDPRRSLSPESLAEELRQAGFTEVSTERAAESVELRVGSEDITRWFSMPLGSGPSYEERLRAKLSVEEVAAYRRLFETALLGRTIRRSTARVFGTARKP